jgi:hypothetical protein
MPTPASDADVAAVNAFLKTAGLKNLRCRKRADTLVIESGPKSDAMPLIRLRRLAATAWAVDAATHTGRWESMPLRGKIVDNLQAIADTFPWLLS